MGSVSSGVYDASGAWEPSLANLGVTDAPLTKAGLAAALQFFGARMPSLSAKDRFGFLKAIDLHKPVREVTLLPPQLVAAFRYIDESPFKLFYTKAGTSVQSLGLNSSERGFRLFRVIGSAPALESWCSSMRDYTSTSLGGPTYGGGGVQYIIPNAAHLLKAER